jgi:hypothetical protein
LRALEDLEFLAVPLVMGECPEIAWEVDSFDEVDQFG